MRRRGETEAGGAGITNDKHRCIQTHTELLGLHHASYLVPNKGVDHNDNSHT